jgi:hypothetical protein
MPGCCLVALLLFAGPRVALVFGWLLSNWFDAIDSTIVALLGFAFLPWTTLAWMFVFFHHHGDIGNGYILPLAAGLILDVGTYGGSQASRQRQLRE